jgi:hypothetical protein
MWGWIHRYPALSPQLNWASNEIAKNEIAIMERLFPQLAGMHEYKQAICRITRESNEILFSVVEELLDSASSGGQRTWTTAKLDTYRKRFLEQLLETRAGFVKCHQSVLLSALHNSKNGGDGSFIAKDHSTGVPVLRFAQDGQGLCDSEVYESALRVSMEQRYVDGVSHFEAVLASGHSAFYRRVEDADVDALVAGASDHPVEELADAVGEGDGSGTFAHGALHLLASGLLQVAVHRNRSQFHVCIWRGLVVQHCLDHPLVDQVGKAAIGRGGVCVVVRGESEVAEWFCVGALYDDVLSCAHELDDGKRDIGIVNSVGLTFLAKKFAQGCGVRLGSMGKFRVAV